MSSTSVPDPHYGMRIGELAEKVGTTTRTIRHYHHIGLLPAPRRLSNGYRMYGAVDLARLLRIRQLRDSGLSLAHIAELLATSPDDPESVLAAVEESLDSQIAELQRRKAMLARIRRDQRAAAASGATGPVAEFDRDAWTLLTAQPGVDLATTDPILDHLAHTDTTELAAASAKFEKLPEDADDATIDALAHLLHSVGTSVMNAAGITPSTEDNPQAGAAVAELAAASLRPAQQRVIERFLELVRADPEAAEHLS